MELSKKLQASAQYWDQRASIFPNRHLAGGEKGRLAFAKLCGIFNNHNILENGDHIFEPACGKLPLLEIYLLNLGLGISITGIDISQEMLNIAQRRANNYQMMNVTLICDDAAHPTISSGQVRKIIAFGCIPHLDPEEAFDSWARLIKPGGHLFIIHEDDNKTLTIKANEARQKDGKKPIKEALPNKELMTKLLEKAGFQIQQYIDNNYYLLDAVRTDCNS